MKEVLFQGFNYILKDDAQVIGLVYETKSLFGFHLKPESSDKNTLEKETEYLFKEIKEVFDNRFNLLFLKISKLIDVKNDSNFKDNVMDCFNLSKNHKEFITQLQKLKDKSLTLPTKENLLISGRRSGRPLLGGKNDFSKRA